MDKQIEEMAKIILEASCKGSECENCEFVKRVEEAKRTCLCLKALYNAGYRKIPENAVVLTREEYEKLKSERDGFENDRFAVCHALRQAIYENKTIRKKTAKKFADRVHNLFNRDIKDSVVYTQEEKTILKEFVESIDEICK